MPSYLLEIEAFGLFTVNTPTLEIWEDGSLDSTHPISSTGSLLSITINYGGSIPTSLEFRFNDAFPDAGRSIEVRNVRINGHNINTGNYLSDNDLSFGQTAIVDIADIDTNDSDFLFDSSEPSLADFTAGATEVYTAGVDRYSNHADSSNQVFDMLAGRDIAYLGGGNDKINGGDGNDIIYGGGGNDLIYGGSDSGRDRIYGGDGEDTLYGGDGNDRLQGDAGDDELHGGDGNDRLNGNDGDDVITGGLGNDKIGGGDGSDFLFGNEGNDQIIAGAGNDTIDGGLGNDLAYGGAGDDQINGGDGDDVLVGDIGNDVIHGDDGDDTIYGKGDDDTVYGGEGNDEVRAGEGIDLVEGGSGDDEIYGDSGDDTLYGDGSYDRDGVITELLTANPGVVYSVATDSFYQLITAGANHTTARANSLGSTLNGVSGHLANITSATENNFIDNLIVADTWIGGTDSGAEGVWLWEDGNEAGEQFWTGAAGGSSVGGFYENWASGEPNDYGSGEDFVTIRTNGTWNDLRGTNSRDYIIEWAAKDVLGSESGNDTLIGGDGNDTIYGDYTSAITGSAAGWFVQYYDLASNPSNLATAGFTLNGGRDNTNTLTSQNVTQDFDPSLYDPTNTNFALKYSTTLTITTGGTYTFQTTSDDGSALFIDGVQIVNNDGLHGAVTVTSAGQVLSAGTYTLEATFFERSGGEVMRVEMSGADTGGSFVEIDNYAGVNVNQTVGSIADGDDIIYGGNGLDILYGGGGSDTFVFETGSAFTQIDEIMDFSTIDGDVIDIADLLTVSFGGTITDFVQFTVSGSDTLVQVDVAGTGSSYSTIASLDNVTSLDEATLFAAGNIVV